MASHKRACSLSEAAPHLPRSASASQPSSNGRGHSSPSDQTSPRKLLGLTPPRRAGEGEVGTSPGQ
eukprot:53676-Alexandrium_andersonii.AAC.1